MTTTHHLSKIQPTIKSMIANGLHIGSANYHKHNLPYVYGIRSNVCIINLNQTLTQLRRSLNVLYEVSKDGGRVLFYNKNRLFSDLCVEAALQSQSYFLSEDKRQGILTNKKRMGFRFLPDIVVMVNVEESLEFAKECANLHIPIIGILDVDTDPSHVLYPIVCNDKSREGVKYVFDIAVDYIKMGKMNKKKAEK